MARSHNNKCIIREETVDGVWGDTGQPRPKYTSWCGKTAHTSVGFKSYAYGDDTCPKCSAAFFASRSGGVTLEKIALPTEYGSPRVYGYGPYGTKSAYKIMRDGECFGLLSIPTGWGQTWEIYALEAGVTVGMLRDGADPVASKSEKPADYLHYDRDLNGDKREVGTQIFAGSNNVVRKPYKTRASKFRSKEAALAEVPDMIADGLLPSETAVLAAARKEMADQLQRQADAAERRRLDDLARTAQIQRDSDELDLIAMAFAEMTTEGKISNFQRDALFQAARRLGIKGLE